MSDIYDLIPEVDTVAINQTKVYMQKYVHDIPEVKSYQREKFLLYLCKNKTVLHIGSNGVFNPKLEKVAKKVYAVDIEECDNEASNFTQMDAENENCFVEQGGEIDIVLAADILEHLSNAGRFLDNLKVFDVPIIIAVPNAFAKTGQSWTIKGKENVHEQHVAYYSYNTLKVLIERYGFNIKTWCWYNGEPRTAEGIIFVVEKNK